ncbi:UNVERIFIED_CONTAM: hypothetical protein Sradi_0007800 [Sesamum radiatum]|uniref:Uncharacterized protein n=1 Tax=Sesamum radiatum TaxID=300843 RepID=A0AAW2WFV6_SESRA
MAASEANSIMMRFRHLRENLQKLNKKFGQLAVNAQVAEQIQRADLDTVQIAIRTTMVASPHHRMTYKTSSKGITIGDDSRVEVA